MTDETAELPVIAFDVGATDTVRVFNGFELVDVPVESMRPALGTLGIRYSFEYRNPHFPEWKLAVFTRQTGGIPSTREDADALLRKMVKQWVAGTELRLIESVDTIVGVYSNAAEPAVES